MSVTPKPSRRRGPRAGVLALALTSGALAFAVAACGSSSSSSAPATSTQPAASAGARPTLPGAYGTIAAVTGTNMQVQNKINGQVTVNFGSSTKITSSDSASKTDITVGSCVLVTGTGTNGATVTAQSVTISQPVNGACTIGGGALSGGTGAGAGTGTRRGGGGRLGGGGLLGKGGGRLRPSAGASPAGDATGAYGTVSAVTGTGFSVKGQARANQPAKDSTVTVTGTTTFSKTITASPTALTVGDCAVALGKADDTGAVAATSISVSKPGKSGCTIGTGAGRAGAGTGGN
jgi:hypothetical protein